MIVLVIRTDKPEAELGLFDGTTKLTHETWQAHRELSLTIHQKINDLLHAHGQSWQSLGGIVLYQGPGSFTGLRIGAAVANTAADTLGIPIVGTSGEDWAHEGIEKLQSGQNDKLVAPHYGRDPHITAPKK